MATMTRLPGRSETATAGQAIWERADVPFLQTRLWQGTREPPAVPYLQTQSQFADFNMQMQPQILALPDAHLQSA